MNSWSELCNNSVKQSWWWKWNMQQPKTPMPRLQCCNKQVSVNGWKVRIGGQHNYNGRWSYRFTSIQLPFDGIGVIFPGLKQNQGWAPPPPTPPKQTLSEGDVLLSEFRLYWALPIIINVDVCSGIINLHTTWLMVTVFKTFMASRTTAAWRWQMLKAHRIDRKKKKKKKNSTHCTSLYTISSEPKQTISTQEAFWDTQLWLCIIQLLPLPRPSAFVVCTPWNGILWHIQLKHCEQDKR